MDQHGITGEIGVTRNRFVVQIWTSAGNTMGLEREARKKESLMAEWPTRKSN